MKNSLFLIGVFAALVGCASTKTVTTASNDRERDWQRYYADRNPSSVRDQVCEPKVGPQCAAKIFWHCPSGFVDACNTPGSTGRHVCVSAPSTIDCRSELAIVCPPAFQDACLTGSSAVHECAPKPSAFTCDQAVAMVCPEGFQDSCLQTP
ncbi:MAG: hypothetical protein ACXVB9_04875 [Bdellovibrionota bacterium]